MKYVIRLNTKEAIDYIQPLIMNESEIAFENGIPKYMAINK